MNGVSVVQCQVRIRMNFHNAARPAGLRTSISLINSIARRSSLQRVERFGVLDDILLVLLGQACKVVQNFLGAGGIAVRFWLDAAGAGIHLTASQAEGAGDAIEKIWSWL